MIGLDISDKSIKVVQISNGKTRKLLAACSEAVPDSAVDNGIVVQPDVVRKLILKMFKENKVVSPKTDAVVASIPETQSFLRVIEVPQMQIDEIGEAIKWEVSQHIPFGLENVYIDWQPLLGKGHAAARGRQEIQVGAAQKKVVDSLHETLSGLKLDIAAFELESQAIVRALVSPELRSRQGLLIVDLGSAATNVVIHDHGAMRFTATLQKGTLKMAETIEVSQRAEVAQQLRSLEGGAVNDFSDQLFPAMEELVIGVRGVVEFYNGIDAQHEVQEIILTGGGANMSGLDKAFLKYFNDVHIQRANPWVNVLAMNDMAKPPLDVATSVRYTTAIGLALRDVIT